MVQERVLRGYLLEEVVAWLLRSSGYELLSAADDKETNPAHRVLEQRPSGLAVRGRGAWHQADALGEFRYVPPFSLPVRLFVEAKFTGRNVRLPTVRNGHGVVHDVNENMVTSVHGTEPSRPRPRYHYSYAVFSTAGFNREAQRVHQALDALPPRRPGHGCTGCAATSAGGSSKSPATTATSATATRRPPCPRTSPGRWTRSPSA
ncbi:MULTISPECIES: hypothetical protein [Streptomyces]|nr:hypothetical protein [Streptomyces canarius]